MVICGQGCDQTQNYDELSKSRKLRDSCGVGDSTRLRNVCVFSVHRVLVIRLPRPISFYTLPHHLLFFFLKRFITRDVFYVVASSSLVTNDRRQETGSAPPIAL